MSVKVEGGDKAFFTAYTMSVKEGGRVDKGFSHWRIAFGLNSSSLYIYEPISKSTLTYSSRQRSSDGSISSL